MTESKSNDEITTSKKIKKKIKNAQLETENKIKRIIHEQFHGVFDEDMLFYTIIFFLGAFGIGVFSLWIRPGSLITSWPLNWVVSISFALVLGFIILFILSLVPWIAEHMFGEGGGWKKKLLFCLIAFSISSLISWAYSSSDPTVEFLQFSTLIPALLIIMFFGWNLIQPHYIKDGMKNIAEKFDNRFTVFEEDEVKRKTSATVYMVIAVIFPYLLHIATIIGFWPIFNTITGEETPEILAEKQSQLFGFYVWMVIFFAIITATVYWQIKLYIKCYKRNTPNVFSNAFYIFLWIIFWYRSYGILNSIRSISSTTADVFVVLTDVALMVATSVLVLRSLGEKVEKSGIIQEEAIPFIVYAFTICYISGQVVMLTQFSERTQLNLANSSMMVVSMLVYYFWYSQHILQRKGYLRRNLMNVEEVKNLVFDYSRRLKTKIPENEDNIDDVTGEILDKYELTLVKLRSKSEILKEINLQKKDIPKTEENIAKDSSFKDTSKYNIIESKEKSEYPSKIDVKFESEDEILDDVTKELKSKVVDTDNTMKFESEDKIKNKIEDELKKRMS